MSTILDNLYCAKGNRFGLRETFAKKPGINADMVIDPDADSASALVAYVIANRDFELLGTNAVTASCAFAVGGGITLTTAGAANDQVILLPHLDTAQTAWAVASWLSQKAPRFETVVETGASVTNYIAWAGLKLTNTHAVATDNDQVYVRVEDDHATYPGEFVVVHSRGGTDIETRTGIIAAASTRYKIVIDVDAQRQFTVTINNKNVVDPNQGSTFPALVTAKSFIPYVGVMNEGGAGAAKALTVRYVEMSCDF